MKKNLLIGALIGATIITAFLGGMYVEQTVSARRENFIREAIEDGDRVIFTDDGGIIKVRHDK